MSNKVYIKFLKNDLTNNQRSYLLEALEKYNKKNDLHIKLKENNSGYQLLLSKRGNLIITKGLLRKALNEMKQIQSKFGGMLSTPNGKIMPKKEMIKEDYSSGSNERILDVYNLYITLNNFIKDKEVDETLLNYNINYLYSKIRSIDILEVIISRYVGEIMTQKPFSEISGIGDNKLLIKYLSNKQKEQLLKELYIALKNNLLQDEFDVNTPLNFIITPLKVRDIIWVGDWFADFIYGNSQQSYKTFKIKHNVSTLKRPTFNIFAKFGYISGDNNLAIMIFPRQIENIDREYIKNILPIKHKDNKEYFEIPLEAREFVNKTFIPTATGWLAEDTEENAQQIIKYIQKKELETASSSIRILKDSYNEYCYDNHMYVPDVELTGEEFDESYNPDNQDNAYTTLQIISTKVSNIISQLEADNLDGEVSLQSMVKMLEDYELDIKPKLDEIEKDVDKDFLDRLRTLWKQLKYLLALDSVSFGRAFRNIKGTDSEKMKVAMKSPVKTLVYDNRPDKIYEYSREFFIKSLGLINQEVTNNIDSVSTGEEFDETKNIRKNVL